LEFAQKLGRETEKASGSIGIGAGSYITAITNDVLALDGNKMKSKGLICAGIVTATLPFQRLVKNPW
jgi:hypothetical protein